jgi:hypothetical protein
MKQVEIKNHKTLAGYYQLSVGVAIGQVVAGYNLAGSDMFPQVIATTEAIKRQVQEGINAIPRRSVGAASMFFRLEITSNTEIELWHLDSLGDRKAHLLTIQILPLC